jgi:hypothetical protein
MVVNTTSGIACCLLMLLLYAIFQSDVILYKTYLYGFNGIIAAFSIAFKQLIPEQEVHFFFLTLRAKHIPGIIVLSAVAFFALGFASHSLPHVLFGVLFSWTYLRFYQRKEDVVGDLSDSFAFYTFFPDPVQPLVNVITRILGAPLRLIGCIPSPTTPSSPSPYTTSPTTLHHDAERRRALAQRAVDARIALLQPSSSSATPSIPLVDQVPVPSPSAASLPYANVSSRNVTHQAEDKT